MNQVAAPNLQLPPERMVPGAGRLGSAGDGKAGWYDRPRMPIRAGRGLRLARETKLLLTAKFAALREGMSQALHT